MAKKKDGELYYLDTGKVMLKILDGGFSIGKVIIRVVEHDTKASEGAKVKDEINYYLEPEKARYLADFILGRIHPDMKEKALAEVKHQKEIGGSYCRPIFRSGIGTDKKNEVKRATQLTLEPGMMKNPWIFKATAGTYKATQTGGCQIDYSDKENLRTIIVPLVETLPKDSAVSDENSRGLYAPNGIQVFAEALSNAVDELLLYRRLSAILEERKED